jgi:hypothetical protein
VEEVVAHGTMVACPVAQHAVTAARRHASEALDVDVEKLPGSLADVAHGGTGEPVGVRQAADAMAAKHRVDGGARVAE